jgi:hypothetical protein
MLSVLKYNVPQENKICVGAKLLRVSPKRATFDINSNFSDSTKIL